MRRLILTVLAMAVLLGGTLGVQQMARAEDQPMTEAHIDRIKANCVEAQTVLNQLHSTDALLRVNQGQLYELVSTKLMAPFNSRVALNRLDGTALVATTASYETEFTAFRRAYRDYEIALAHVLKVNCVKQPVEFYDSVASARSKRQSVRASVVRLNHLLTQYHDDFLQFRAELNKQGETNG